MNTEDIDKKEELTDEVLETPAEEVLETPEEAPETEGAPDGSIDESLDKLKEFTEKDEDMDSSVSLKSILGGDFLTAQFMRKQLGVIILIAIFFVLYISNRYTNQAELIEIDNLKKELDDARFNALTRNSELTAKSRQSYVEDFLRNSKDSTLEISSNPPYIIHENGESELPDEGIDAQLKTVNGGVKDTVQVADD